ncbi:hypothetical protein [Companilactobacillus kedongensis]|uniref:hypothetical protein n=1 Tax=Companilactobacillus kedongensis TaxID=2486004 RepID=UPI000F79A665|nr:hypothetical protein [Companilactobacillus kedongensis]
MKISKSTILIMTLVLIIFSGLVGIYYMMKKKNTNPFIWEFLLCILILPIIFLSLKFSSQSKVWTSKIIIEIATLILALWGVSSSISSYFKDSRNTEIQNKINEPKFQTTLTMPWKVESNGIDYPIWKLNNYGESRVSIEKISNKFYLSSVMRINYLMPPSYMIQSSTYAPIVIPLPSMSESVSSLSGETTGTLATVNRVNIVSGLSKDEWIAFQSKFKDIGEDTTGIRDDPSSNIDGQIYKVTPSRVIRIEKNKNEPGNVTSIDLPKEWEIMCKTDIDYRVDGQNIKKKVLLSTTNNNLWNYYLSREQSMKSLDIVFKDAQEVSSLRYQSEDSYFDIAVNQINQASDQKHLSQFARYFETSFGNDSQNIKNAQFIYSSDESNIIGIKNPRLSRNVSSDKDKYPHSIPKIAEFKN